MALLNPEDIAYLRQKTTAEGYNPQTADDLLKVYAYESSSDPTRWGGKNNAHLGLIQFGKPERDKYGVDTQHPNARNQIDATFRYLKDRGYTPAMGLLDLYSTVNAGSPGHYNASDRPGMTVASHVARMGGATPQSQPSPPTPEPPPFSTYPTPQPPASPTTPTTAANSLPIFAQLDTPVAPEAAPSEETAPQYDKAAMRGLLASLFPQDVAQAQEAPQAAPELPQAPPMPMKRGRGLAFQQLTIRTPKFTRQA